MRHARLALTSSRHLAFALLAAATFSAAAQTSRTLHNGDSVDLRGILVIERRGWNEFLVLHTPVAYTLAPETPDAAALPQQSPDTPKPEPVPAPTPTQTHEIGITLPGQDELIAGSAGKLIRVSGQLRLAPASTVYWNGTLLWATAVALPTGDYIGPRLLDPGLVPTIRRYTASATLQPKLWPRLYTARDLDTHRSLPTPNLAGCRVTGAGDGLNCFCSDGFHPVQGLLHTGTGASPATLTATAAHFALSPPADTPITAEIECTRTPPKD